jgi:hypothetical protein
MGFHDGYLNSTTTQALVPPRPQLHGYERRAFDQGLGRAVWFLAGAEPVRAVALINSVASPRRADLWSGLGLAVAYAGGTDRAGLELLRAVSARHLPAFAQGIAFAAEARRLAENIVPHTELACAMLGMTASEAAEVTRSALLDLPTNGIEPGYEAWRRKIQHCLAAREMCRVQS